MSVYDNCPFFITPSFTMRLVRLEDAPGLLKVYSDKQAQHYFNCDNSDSDFRYATLQEMEQCIEFWLASYAQKNRVRWTILDNRQRPVGTVEMFPFSDGADGKGEAILRIDLMSRFEFTDIFQQILLAILPAMHEIFRCERILTKALPHMMQRRLGLVLMGFIPCQKPLTGYGSVELPHYWARRHRLA